MTARYWRIERTASIPQYAGNVAVRKRAATIAIVTRWGGFVCNTPLSIVVDDTRNERTYRVIDVTRLATLLLGGLSLTALLLSQIAVQRARQVRPEENHG